MQFAVGDGRSLRQCDTAAIREQAGVVQGQGVIENESAATGLQVAVLPKRRCSVEGEASCFRVKGGRRLDGERIGQNQMRVRGLKREGIAVQVERPQGEVVGAGEAGGRLQPQDRGVVRGHGGTAKLQGTRQFDGAAREVEQRSVVQCRPLRQSQGAATGGELAVVEGQSGGKREVRPLGDDPGGHIVKRHRSGNRQVRGGRSKRERVILQSDAAQREGRGAGERGICRQVQRRVFAGRNIVQHQVRAELHLNPCPRHIQRSAVQLQRRLDPCRRQIVRDRQILIQDEGGVVQQQARHRASGCKGQGSACGFHAAVGHGNGPLQGHVPSTAADSAGNEGGGVLQREALRPRVHALPSIP